eukprot:GHVQ01012726.1.p1 GENE.GHVQ01012726.1~~GHVQ01012726.1.p1  ORF type:complete len:120 (+),score=13.32 GHVQ01012726.1:165-524(+)
MGRRRLVEFLWGKMPRCQLCLSIFSFVASWVSFFFSPHVTLLAVLLSHTSTHYVHWQCGGDFSTFVSVCEFVCVRHDYIQGHCSLDATISQLLPVILCVSHRFWVEIFRGYAAPSSLVW